MLLELQVIAGCIASKTCYEATSKHLESKDLTPEAQKVLRHIGEYYERDGNATECDRAIIEANVRSSIPEHQDKHRELFQQFLDRVPRTVSSGNVLEYIVGIKRDRIQSEIHQACLARVDSVRFKGLLDKWEEVAESVRPSAPQRSAKSKYSRPHRSHAPPYRQRSRVLCRRQQNPRRQRSTRQNLQRKQVRQQGGETDVNQIARAWTILRSLSEPGEAATEKGKRQVFRAFPPLPFVALRGNFGGKATGPSSSHSIDEQPRVKMRRCARAKVQEPQPPPRSVR